jgi:chromosome segregation ATPase
MIESLMLMALGFLVATLFAIIAAQFVWRRAVRVTTLQLAGDGDEAEKAAKTREMDELLSRQERERAPLQAELETLRAEHREFAGANEELANANAKLASENKDLANEVKRLKAELSTLRGDIESAATERAERLAAVRRALDGLETAMTNEARHDETARTEQPARVPAAPLEPSKGEAVQVLEPYPADRDLEDDAAADARTLAEVKASLARLDAMGLDNPEAFESEDETPPDDEADETPAPGERSRDGRTGTAQASDSHIGDKALMERIRALEAGVSP